MSRVLFVRSGGGFPGIDIHAGIWMALEEHNIRPDEVAGTSAGAIVSGIQATGCSAELIVEVARQLRDSDLRHHLPLWQLRLPWIDHILQSEPVAQLMRDLIANSFADLRLPLSAYATRVETGESVNVATPLISESPVQACLASMSIGGIFPAVTMHDGYSYIDGGVRANLPLPPNWQTYDQVWLLIASSRPRDYAHRRGVITHLIRNIDYLMQDQIEDVLVDTHGSPKVHVVWPNLHANRGMLHFDHRLIDQAYHQTCVTVAALLNSGGIP